MLATLPCFIFLGISGLITGCQDCEKKAAIPPDIGESNQESLDQLIAQIPSVASPGTGINQAEQKFSIKIQEYGTAAADALVPLLATNDEDAYDLVAYCRNNLNSDSLQERHLDPIAKAARQNHSWLPNAIADINTPEAIDFLAKDFRRAPQTMAQIDNALERCAPESILPLIRKFRQAAESETEFMDALVPLFKDCGKRASQAVAPLLEISLDETQAPFRRLAAIKLLGAIGPSSRTTFPELQKLAQKNQDVFGEPVQDAISSSRTPEAADILLEPAISTTRTEQNYYALRDFATRLGHAAKHLAPELAKHLDDPDPHLRLGACRSLGYLGDPGVWPQLVEKLESQNWQVAYSAALSLTQLGAVESRPALEKCRAHFWFPRVKHAADYALRRLAGEVPTKLDFERLGSSFNTSIEDSYNTFDFANRTLWPLNDLGEIPLATGKNKGHLELYFALPPDDDFWIEIREQQKGDGCLQTDAPEIFQSLLREMPDDAEGWKNNDLNGPWIQMIRFSKTTFVFLNSHGKESGVYIIENGQSPKNISSEITKSMTLWNEEIVLTEGWTHMGIDIGNISRTLKKDGVWTVDPWLPLPGYPESSGILKDGRLFANCSDGAIALTKEGIFEYLGSGTEPKPDQSNQSLLPALGD